MQKARKMAQKALQTAKKAKKDEFYTVSATIEDELKYYKNQFKGKVVFAIATTRVKVILLSILVAILKPWV